ncbi:hypothetical protein COUCH_00460 [Couchioplanes caeruleus]|uniref:hypothetical protein n=1 Tax=Couchioplanes caeruleus TaxID=56438 RepID=UPI0020C11435|nr:hypothetical protein [Couchioplanes caeruleus]UQU64875.1 hypothetical protein COUCH_00460 [Couchioplanes caeruleus]
MSEPLPPTGPELGRRNRRLIAKRTGWPEGAVEACERIEDAFPAWSVSWRHENVIPGFLSPEGFYAERPGRYSWDKTVLYGADAEKLLEQIAEHSEAESP